MNRSTGNHQRPPVTTTRKGRLRRRFITTTFFTNTPSGCLPTRSFGLEPRRKATATRCLNRQPIRDHDGKRARPDRPSGLQIAAVLHALGDWAVCSDDLESQSLAPSSVRIDESHRIHEFWRDIDAAKNARNHLDPSESTKYRFCDGVQARHVRGRFRSFCSMRIYGDSYYSDQMSNTTHRPSVYALLT